MMGEEVRERVAVNEEGGGGGLRAKYREGIESGRGPSRGRKLSDGVDKLGP